MKQIEIAMSKVMYDDLLNGRKDVENSVSFRGCGSKAKVIEYVNQTFGLLGEVVNIQIDS